MPAEEIEHATAGLRFVTRVIPHPDRKVRILQQEWAVVTWEGTETTHATPSARRTEWRDVPLVEEG